MKHGRASLGLPHFRPAFLFTSRIAKRRILSIAKIPSLCIFTLPINCETKGAPSKGEYQMARSVNFVAMGQPHNRRPTFEISRH